ncbi:MAG: copper homeostasis protein CutC [Bacteroidia bacterium]
MLLEICVETIESALAAQEAGTDRLELCSDLKAGGLTPDFDLIKVAKEKIQLPIHIMIRPRAGNFFYTAEEFEKMKTEIKTVKQLNTDGVVFGILTGNGDVDVKRTRELVELSKPMKVTFHRAFDVAKNPFDGLERIIECGCDTLLTSGQKEKAIEGVDLIRQLYNKANRRIEIMAGSGITDKNILEIVLQSRVESFHASAKKIVSENNVYEVDKEIVRAMKNKLNSYLR